MAERFYISYPGEYYDDCITVEATLNNRTRASELTALVVAQLIHTKTLREELVQYLADKRGISFKEMWEQILAGDYKPLSVEEKKDLDRIKRKGNKA